MGGRSGVDQPTIGSVGAKPVGVEVGVKRPTEPRGDGGALRQAYFDKDIKLIDKAIGSGWEGVDLLKQLRDFDWEGLPVPDWWR